MHLLTQARVVRLTAGLVFVLPLLCAQIVANGQSDTLHVLSFNILYGGDEIDFEKVIEVIQKANPDVVGIQEAEGNIPRLASALGWKHYDSRLHLLSKYPIFSNNLHPWYYAYIELRPGKSVAVFNIHLPSDPYGPDLIRDGASVEEVLKNEYQLRYPELDTFALLFNDLSRKKIPTLVTGDFNSPSHRDWTTEAHLMRRHMHYPVDWVVSKRMEENGFTDTYRSHYPDPRKNPGLTWTPATPPIVGANETHDRIDFIWARDIERVLTSTLIGEAISNDVSIAVSPFPSDHRAVLSSLIVEPVSVGALIRTYSDGRNLRVLMTTGGFSDVSLRVTSKETAYTQTIPITGAHKGEVLLTDLTPASYRISLISGSEEIAFTEVVHNFNVSEMALRLPKFEFTVGEPIPVFWENAPENRYDWVAVYEDSVQTQADFYRNDMLTNYILYCYTRASSNGMLVLDKNSKIKLWPLPVGKYRVHFLLDDGYTSVASVPFVVKP